MEQKKTALSAQLRNMDTLQRQWEEGCPKRLNTTPHLSLEVRVFLHFFPCLPQNPEQRQESDCLIRFSHFCVTLSTALNVKIRQRQKNEILRIRDFRKESFGEEHFPLISQKFAIKSQSNVLSPAAVFHSQSSFPQADRHPAERLNQPLQLYDFLPNRCLHRIVKGGDGTEDAIRGNHFFFFLFRLASLELFALTPEVLILPLSQQPMKSHSIRD